MNSNIKIFIFCLIFLFNFQGNLKAQPGNVYKESIIKERAKASGYALPSSTHIPADENMAAIGKDLFESENLSLNGGVACVSCHFDKAASGDGLPNAIGIGGDGEGISRYKAGGKVVPRNTLALWGVGGKGFSTFFWDGRVSSSGETITSQFGKDVPSEDLLITAVHLPVVEIRETLQEDYVVKSYKKETTSAAVEIYKRVVENLIVKEPALMKKLAKEIGVNFEEIEFINVATALAHFIRSEFKLRPSKFSKFIEGEISLNEDELNGGLLFYGKGGCVSCHSGPYFSDFNFYTVPFPQLGFGKNGFGIDYGLYNSTFNPEDQYKFRTPSLHNVSKTAPYSHSGAIMSLDETIQYHFDPLQFFDAKKMTPLQRHQYNKYLAKSDTNEVVQYLNDKEVSQIASFLKTLDLDENEK